MTDAVIEKTYDWGPKNGGAAKHVVVFLHGVGSNGQDLISLAPYFAPYLPDSVFISPDAPFACDMVPAGYPDSYQWFSLQNRDPHVMLSGVETVFPVLEVFLDEVMRKYQVEASQIALVGFSQGTMTSLYSAPRLKAKIAGVLGYSGALIGAEGFTQDPDEYHRMPIRLIHGEADDVVPVEAYHAAHKQLSDAGFDVSGHTTPGLTHSIDEQGIAAGGAFLKSIFAD